jgi:hypothetical protein
LATLSEIDDYIGIEPFKLLFNSCNLYHSSSFHKLWLYEVHTNQKEEAYERCKLFVAYTRLLVHTAQMVHTLKWKLE